MNPNDNSPISPSGVGGMTGGSTSSSSTVPGPVDFTNPSSLSSSSSLSMADSLASAQDNLTSAGQAASTGYSSAVGLDSLGAESAAMVSPSQALKPADPVPGSIGSVTSMPPIAPSPSSMTGMDSSTSSATTTGNPFLMGAGSSTMSGASAGTSTTKPVQPYYNPFARTQGTGATGSAMPTSSSKIPPALQPQSEKFSNSMNGAGGKKGSGNIMPMLGWIMAVVFAITTAVFVFLWLTKKGEERIIYKDPIVQEPVSQKIDMMTCTQDFGAEPVEGLEGLSGHSRETAASFTDGKLKTVNMVESYAFVDAAAAEASRGLFDNRNAFYAEVASNLGIQALTAELSIADAAVTYSLSGTDAQLSGDYIAAFALTPAVDGSVDGTLEVVKANYENSGFVCVVE